MLSACEAVKRTDESEKQRRLECERWLARMDEMAETDDRVKAALSDIEEEIKRRADLGIGNCSVSLGKYVKDAKTKADRDDIIDAIRIALCRYGYKATTSDVWSPSVTVCWKDYND